MIEFINTVMSNPAPDMYKQFTVVWLLRLGVAFFALNLAFGLTLIALDIVKMRKP